MKATNRTTLALGDLLQIPIGIANATSGDEAPKLEAAFADGTKRQQRYIHPDEWTTCDQEVRDAETGEVKIDTYEVPVDPVLLDSGQLAPPFVTDADLERGVFAGKVFHRVDPDVVDEAKRSTKLETVELLEFIDYRRVPTDRLVGSYWIQADDGFAKPMGVLMEAMRRAGRAMVVKFTMRDRQRLGVMRVRKVEGGHALMLNGVVFASQWRPADEDVLAASQAQVSEEAVVSAMKLLNELKGDGDALETARDELVPKMEEIVERAVTGAFGTGESVDADQKAADQPTAAAEPAAAA